MLLDDSELGGARFTMLVPNVGAGGRDGTN